jgi:C4-dicarboxylate-specific signal transduction histidine kinase
MRERIHPEDRPIWGQAAAEALGGASRCDLEYRVVRPNGELRIVHSQGDLTRDASGRPRSLFGTIQDITERKRAEEALREVQMELTHANRVTTIGQLTASVAHEVNQPIAAAVTNAQAALRWLGAQPPDLEEVRQALGRIIKNGGRAGDVIGRIRALIKKAPPRKDRFDLNEAILDVIALTRSEVLKYGVSLQAQLPTGLPAVDGDRIQLQQVILNLILNAVEAMSDIDEGARQDQHRDGCRGRRARHRARYRSGPGPDECGPPVRGLLHDQARRHGHGPVDLPFDHRGARGTIVGLRE